jgi:hypothetical protein
MKNKTLGLFAFSLFALALLASFASAALTGINLTSAPPTNINESTISFDIVFNLTSDATGTFISTSTVSAGNLSFNPISVINGVTSVIATVTLPSGFSGETISGNINVNTNGVDNQTLPFSVNVLPSEVLESETIENVGELDVKKIDFTNKGSQYATFGEDNEWFPFEEVVAEITIDNKGDYDVSDIQVSWGLWSTVANDWVIDFDEEGKDFNLDKGDEKTLTVTFKIDNKMDIDLDELTDGQDYRFYVVATGKIDDKDSSNDGDDTSVNEFEAASIIIESDFTMLDDLVIPEAVSCSETVELTGDIWNIGDSDQDEVSLEIYSKELGIDETIDIGDMNAFDNTPFAYTFRLPEGLNEKIYSLQFTLYNEDGEAFQNDLNDDDAVFSVPLKVEGACTARVSVTASLESDVFAGKPAVIKATIKNTGTKTATYSLNAVGFTSWADSIDFAKSSLTLDAGKSEDVLVTVNVKADASGEKSFDIEILSNNQLAATQQVSLLIETSSSSLTGFFANFSQGQNTWTIWAIVALNAIVVVAIIAVLVRVLRKKQQ